MHELIKHALDRGYNGVTGALDSPEQITRASVALAHLRVSVTLRN